MSHTEYPVMKFFVWIQGPKGPEPQAWQNDYSINPNNQKPKEGLVILKKIELKGTEQYLSFKALIACYPYEPGEK